MKQLLAYTIFAALISGFTGCKKSGYGNYPGGQPYDVIGILDVRPLYKGQDITLTKENLYGATKLAAVVISDHSAGNLPAGLLIVQDNRRVNLLRGISIDMGAAAANYQPGDSLMIDIIGGTLTRKDGILTITGITESDIQAKGKGIVGINAINTTELKAHPDFYESSLVILNKSSFNPAPQPDEVISGTKVINDGFGDLTLYTDPAVDYANTTPFGLAAYVGIPFPASDGTMQLRTRNEDDMVNMGSSAQDLVISGFLGDPRGGDGGHEYVQLMATKDINFATTPFSIVFCTNSGNSITATPLDAGWATGGQRTIKYNINSGSVLKGNFFYFGFQGKKLNGSGSANSFPASANWYQKTYLTSGTNPNRGDGGLVRNSTFGTSGPWPNSGNACGVALFKGTSVTATSVPHDVLFVASGGNQGIYDASKNPVLGYRICNNDWYSMFSIAINPDTYKPEVVPYLYYRSPGNTTFMPYAINMAHPTAPADAGLFNMMGGVYNIKLGKWTTARKQVVVELEQATATIDSLELNEAITRLEE